MKELTGPKIMSHNELEAYLGRYCGLMLYMREMDESIYGKTCGVKRSHLCEHAHGLTLFSAGLLFCGQRSAQHADESPVFFLSGFGEKSFRRRYGPR